MKQIKLIRAFDVIKKINATSMKGVSISTQLKLYNLQKSLTPAYEFQIEKEKAIFEKYPPTRIDESGIVYENEDGTPDIATVRECQKEINELNNLENDTIKIEPVHITMEEAEALKPDNDYNIMEILDDILIIDSLEPQVTIEPISLSAE